MDVTTRALPIGDINADQEIQSRAAIDQLCVERYCEDMMTGATFPPLGVVFDGERHWHWDGFHRLAAWRLVGSKSVLCEIRPGTRNDALFMCCGSNASHGPKRTREDKVRAVRLLLSESSLSHLSSSAIAKHVHVSSGFVEKVRTDHYELLGLSTVRADKNGRLFRANGQLKKVRDKVESESIAETEQAAAEIDDDDAAEKSSYRDAYNCPVPAITKGDFELAEKLKQVSKALYSAAKSLRYMGTHQLPDLYNIGLELKELTDRIEAGTPHCVCPE